MWDPKKPYRAALRKLADEVLQQHENLIRNESGYVLTRILDCKLRIVKFNPIGSRYHPLPKHLASKKSIVNVRNFDERCFGYAVLASLKDTLPGHHKSEARYYKEADFEQYHLDQIEYPVPVQTIPDLEDTLDMSFTVWSISDDEGRGLYSLYHSEVVRARHIVLLYYNDHYAWIKDIEKLVGCKSKHGNRIFYHLRCGSRFTVEKEYIRHIQVCTRE